MKQQYNKQRYYSKIPRTFVPNVPDPKMTLQCTATTPVKPPVPVFGQLLFGSSVFLRMSLHQSISVCYF
jgi:hypothetical protein